MKNVIHKQSNFYRITLAFLLFGILLFVVGCSSDDELPSSSQDENLTTLETVLENTFTGPNQKLNELLEDPNNATIIGEDSETKSPESPTELDLFLEERYQSHFTDDMFGEYIGTYALSYHPSENNSMEIDSIDIQQNETDEITYDFTTKVQYQKAGNEPNIYNVTGQANFSEEGKIAGFEFFSDEGLSEALRES
ncbi:hypothetical protein [Oceanobacillus bengalensis]|uniref:Uncharacterized protein n=1 Tax=Oceanobacillus bengalensis TaxID=1435466 RepID=A0A494Z3X1_9BACI|nr:hypothetical protein [Oceanobacillus bengalensis]RKQ17180.1 hypothetical protein D8M05_05820 [Oceanobacillus bengalensis]